MIIFHIKMLIKNNRSKGEESHDLSAGFGQDIKSEKEKQ